MSKKRSIQLKYLSFSHLRRFAVWQLSYLRECARLWQPMHFLFAESNTDEVMQKSFAYRYYKYSITRI